MANIYTDIKLFDAEAYLANNADVAAAGYTVENVAEHYVQYGAAEGRAPNAWFDIDFYREQNADLAEVPAGELLFHFAKYGAAEGRNPNPAFGEGQTIAANLFLDYALANKDLQEAFGIAADATRLTDEQQAAVANHFFTYGINEGREGGIADVSTNETDAVLKALNAYQAELTAQTDAVKAEKEVIKSAAEHDKVTLATDADADAAKTAVENAVKTAEGSVKQPTGFTNPIITGDVSDTKIANAEKVLQATVDAAKAAVAEEKANAPTVVAIQEQLKAQADAAEAAKAVNVNYKGELVKFDELNTLIQTANVKLVNPSKAVPADATKDAPFYATFTVDADTTVTPNITAKDFVITVINGKTVVYSGKAADIKSWKDGVPATDTDGKVLLEKATDKDLKDVKGLDAWLDAVVAVEGNNAALAKANAAVEDAVVKALKADGYKLYSVDSDGKGTVSSDWAKALTVESSTGAVKLATSGYAISKKGLDTAGKVVADTSITSGNSFYTAVTQDASKIATATFGVENVKPADAAALKLDNTVFVAQTVTPPTPNAIKDAAENSGAAVKALADSEKNLKAFQEAVETYNELKAIQTELADAAKAVEAAGEAVEAAAAAFEDLGVNLVTDVTTDGTVNDEEDEDQPIDLFVYSGEQLAGVANFDGDDLFYFGDAAVALVVADKANLAAGKQLGGEADVLEIFAVQDGANTVLYVEKEAFAGNSSNLVDENNEDFVKIELVGVNAEDLQFDGGFLTLA